MALAMMTPGPFVASGFRRRKYVFAAKVLNELTASQAFIAGSYELNSGMNYFDHCKRSSSFMTSNSSPSTLIVWFTCRTTRGSPTHANVSPLSFFFRPTARISP
jgi:hypothetical protein